MRLFVFVALFLSACCDPCPSGYAYYQGACLYVIDSVDVDGGND